MNIPARLCLLYLMWYQATRLTISSVIYEKTSLDFSLLRNIQHTPIPSSQSPIECAVECSLDQTCHGFGYREVPSQECLLTTTTYLNTTHPHNLGGFEYFLLPDLPSHCGQVSSNESGLALLQLGDGQPIEVYCEQGVDGGGWLVFQQRSDGSENFYRNWEDYKFGFGNPSGEFWIGNENLHQLTKNGNADLLIELQDLSGVKKEVKYRTFIVESEAMKYQLKISGYEGGNQPGDSFSIHNGMNFTTYDRDNDALDGVNCAVAYHGAWWYNHCHSVHLNGLYGSTEYGLGINWAHWKGHNYSLPFVRMMVKF